jgi:hypothetical protein
MAQQNGRLPNYYQPMRVENDLWSSVSALLRTAFLDIANDESYDAV